MKITKREKGITLVALIITVVVLLILAVVTINSITKEGIILHANNAAIKYNGRQGAENDIIIDYNSTLNEYVGNDTGVTSKKEWKLNTSKLNFDIATTTIAVDFTYSNVQYNKIEIETGSETIWEGADPQYSRYVKINFSNSSSKKQYVLQEWENDMWDFSRYSITILVNNEENISSSEKAKLETYFTKL